MDSGDAASGLIEGTTRTDAVQDSGIIDMGYHYRPAEAEPFIVAGPGPAYENPPAVRIFPAGPDPTHIIEFDAYGPDHFGVEVSCGEVNGDSRADILTGAGPGEIYGPHVRGFQVDGTPLPGLSFLAYGTNRFGVNVAAGDIDGDGFDEIVTGAGLGAGTPVKVYLYDGTRVTQWFSLEAFEGLSHGTTVAAGRF